MPTDPAAVTGEHIREVIADKLAKSVPAGRREVCQDWREPRVVEDTTPLYGREQPPNPPSIPARCPRCG